MFVGDPVTTGSGRGDDYDVVLHRQQLPAQQLQPGLLPPARVDDGCVFPDRQIDSTRGSEIRDATHADVDGNDPGVVGRAHDARAIPGGSNDTRNVGAMVRGDDDGGTIAGISRGAPDGVSLVQLVLEVRVIPPDALVEYGNDGRALYDHALPRELGVHGLEMVLLVELRAQIASLSRTVENSGWGHREGLVLRLVDAFIFEDVADHSLIIRVEGPTTESVDVFLQPGRHQPRLQVAVAAVADEAILGEAELRHTFEPRAFEHTGQFIAGRLVHGTHDEFRVVVIGSRRE